MEKYDYFLFGRTVCRELLNGEIIKFEVYRIGEGWQKDVMGIRDSVLGGLHGMNDYIGDVNVLTEETALKIIAKQEELQTTAIPGLHWGGSYTE